MDLRPSHRRWRPIGFVLLASRARGVRTVRCCSSWCARRAAEEADELAGRLCRCANLRAVTQAARTALRRAEVPEPEASADYLAGSVVGLFSRGEVRRHGGRAVTADEVAGMERLFRRKLVDREPVQYLVGNWDFHDLNLTVRAPVLIPRPETEELVDLVLRATTQANDCRRQLRILDIGTGTGAILLALLNHLGNAVGTGIDVSSLAIGLARENARNLGLEGRCHTEQVGVEDYQCASEFDLIVSNPPYIPNADMAKLEAELVLHEDDKALRGGPDGLDIVVKILQRSQTLLRPGGDLWLEVDPTHPDTIADLSAHAESPYGELVYVQTFTDFNGHPRFCHLRRRTKEE